MNNMDDIMRDYVKFICSYIPENCGASVSDTSGFPMKGNYVPVKVKILDMLSRSIEFEIESLGFKKQVLFYMSREWGPKVTFSKFQRKIDEMVGQIIKENGLDRHEIFQKHHPLTMLREAQGNIKITVTKSGEKTDN